jgi:hypothetical protein
VTCPAEAFSPGTFNVHNVVEIAKYASQNKQCWQSPICRERGYGSCSRACGHEAESYRSEDDGLHGRHSRWTAGSGNDSDGTRGRAMSLQSLSTPVAWRYDKHLISSSFTLVFFRTSDYLFSCIRASTPSTARPQCSLHPT